jgi:DNA polymerase-1
MELLNQPLLLLVDGHSVAFRSFFAFANRGDGGLRTSSGIPTSVSYGFIKALLDILDREKPQALGIAFDLGGATFRHEADVNYKANRSETPPDFIVDMANLQQILQAMELAVFSQPGYEADDVLGTIATHAMHSGYRVKIMSGDRDLFQLIDPEARISVLHLGQKDKISEFHAAEVKEKMGIYPHQVVDYKALCGDASDNIPGVRGIGEKTAVKLINEYGDLKTILDNLPNIKGAIQKKLQEGIADAQHSQFLAKIEVNVPVEFKLEDCHLKGFNTEAVIPLLEQLEFTSFVRKIHNINTRFGNATSDDVNESNSGEFRNQSSDQNISEADALWFDFANDSATKNVNLTNSTEHDLSIQLPDSQTNSRIDLRPQIIDDETKLNQLVTLLENLSTPVAWDTETSALNPHDALLVGIGCCWGDATDAVAYIPLRHESGQNLNPELLLTTLAPLLKDPTKPKILQNAKFDRLCLRNNNLELNGVIFDTMLASYVLDPDQGHSLDAMVMKYLGLQTTSYKQLVGKHQSIAEISIPDVAKYCGADAYFTYKLYHILKSELEQYPELAKLFYEVEVPLEPILAAMEWLGIRIDKDYLGNFAQKLDQDLEQIATNAYAQAGKIFNLNSPKQLAEILVELLGDKFIKKSRKSKTGYSTDVAVLNKLAGEHPLIDTILEHRTLAKLKSTYVDALPTLIHPETQRIHTDFNQAVTSTGRLSSSNPNLQNIPIRTAFSKQIRAAFLPQNDWLLLSADYSQIELRIMAHLSGEPHLVAAYNANEDVHTRTAQLLLEKETVSSEERRLAKIINYGVLYGMGAQKFSRETGISVKEAKQFIDKFNQRYARIFEYMQEIETFAETHGYVTTILGRRRYFHGLEQMAGYQKAALLRSAVNAPIQGASADIIKVAMINLADLLTTYQARLLLQVHDELVFEIPPDEVEILAPKIKEIMENAVSLTVPLVVDLHWGKNWMEAK